MLSSGITARSLKHAGLMTGQALHLKFGRSIIRVVIVRFHPENI